MSRLLTYDPKDTWIHRLERYHEAHLFLAWSIVSMITYDTMSSCFHAGEQSDHFPGV